MWETVALKAAYRNMFDHGHALRPPNFMVNNLTMPSDLMKAFSDTPRLTTAVLWAASRDEEMVVEHLVNIGRRDAEERAVHFLLELGARLTAQIESISVLPATASIAEDLQHRVGAFGLDCTYAVNLGVKHALGNQGSLTWDLLSDSINIFHSETYIEVENTTHKGL